MGLTNGAVKIQISMTKLFLRMSLGLSTAFQIPHVWNNYRNILIHILSLEFIWHMEFRLF